MNEPKQIVSAQNRLGETPIWEPEENVLYWLTGRITNLSV
jgi:sugar lactone lactonase YvrE